MRLTFLFKIVFICVFLNASFAQNQTIQPLLSKGIYDGRIGKDNLILVISAVTNELSAGYYVHNGKKPVEDDHAFSSGYSENKLLLVSDEHTGIFNGDITENGVSGKIILDNSSKSIFFWKNQKRVHFTKREEMVIPTINRYKEEVFKDIEVRKNLVYGHAVGYWTETPYLDDPYIEILAKGTVNLFKGEKKLALKLDIYQPVNDAHKTRPLLLLVHGGAFYVGNKQSQTEQILAEKFTRMGYVVASMDYRMGFKFKGDDIERSGYKAIQDIHAALRFLSNNAKSIGIDPTQIYVAGTSAGAMASLNVAFLENDERPNSTYAAKKLEDLGDIEKSGNPLKNKFEIKGVVNMWGALTDTLLIDSYERIPVISFHGTEDDIVPIDHSHPFKNTLRINRLVMDEVYGSYPIHERLSNLGIENKLVIFEGMGHEPQLDKFSHINNIIHEISDEMTLFLYRQTATKVEIKSDIISIDASKKLKPINIEATNGEVKYIEIEGGLLSNKKTNKMSVIWLKDHPNPHLKLYMHNKFDAWSFEELNVEITP